MAEHRIEFVQFVDATGDLLHGHAELIRQLTLLRVIGGQKFVQRRIEKPDRGRQTF